MIRKKTHEKILVSLRERDSEIEAIKDEISRREKDCRSNAVLMLRQIQIERRFITMDIKELLALDRYSLCIEAQLFFRLRRLKRLVGMFPAAIDDFPD